MRISVVVDALTGDLAALGSLGSDETAEAARRLAVAMSGPLTARLVDMLGQAAAELDAALPTGRIEVRLVGGDVELVFVPTEPVPDAGPAEPASDGDADARITLRLPTALKSRVESAADQDGVSVNTYIIRRLSTSSSARMRTADRGVGRRLSGYGRS